MHQVQDQLRVWQVMNDLSYQTRYCRQRHAMESYRIQDLGYLSYLAVSLLVLWPFDNLGLISLEYLYQYCNLPAQAILVEIWVHSNHAEIFQMYCSCPWMVDCNRKLDLEHRTRILKRLFLRFRNRTLDLC